MLLAENTLALIDGLTRVYAADFERNYSCWPERITDGNHELIEELNACTSQRQAAEYLTRWLKARFEYLDSRRQ